MLRRTPLLACLLCLACATAPLPLAPKPLTVYARPQALVSAVFQPVQIEIVIPWNPPNRSFCIEIEGPSFYSSSCADLIPGLNVFSSFGVRLNEDGKYEVRAVLLGEGGKELAHDEVDVLVGVQTASAESPPSNQN